MRECPAAPFSQALSAPIDRPAAHCAAKRGVIRVQREEGMRRVFQATLSVIACVAIVGSAGDVSGAPRAKAKKKVATVNCAVLRLDIKGDMPMTAVTLPPSEVCIPVKRNGFLLPDPDCTPGAINPTLTIAVLRNARFRTSCLRDKATSAEKKKDTYDWYHQNHPANNTGKTQVCELDHLISLELGGADTLDNIWPQCGPNKVVLNNRFFKQKDTVENYLAWLVKNDRMDLAEAQKGISTNWTQYIAKAKMACPGGKCLDANLPPR
jgi:hypothetical protein